MGLAGCASQIQNKISPEEYAVYRAWVTQHFETSPPVELMFAPLTITKDPLAFPGCKDKLHKDGVSWALMKELSAVGEAQYPIDEGYRGGIFRGSSPCLMQAPFHSWIPPARATNSTQSL